MSPNEARRMVARFLAGGAVSPEEFARAREACQVHPDTLGPLLDELAWGADPEACQVFAENAAAFAELSEERRLKEEPELARHLEGCPSCQERLRSLEQLPKEPVVTAAAPPVSPAPAAAAVTPGPAIFVPLVEATNWSGKPSAAADRGRRVLNDAIAVRLNRRGLLASMSGPREELLQTVAITAGTLGPAEGEAAPNTSTHKEWRIEDQEAGCAFRLALEGAATGLTLRVSVEGYARDDPPPPWKESVDVELYKEGARFPRDTGPLRIFPAGLKLEAGQWRVRLEALTAVGKRAWEARLAIEDE